MAERDRQPKDPRASDERGPVFISCLVNGRRHQATVSVERRLADMLRDDLGMTGTKLGCEVGVCGTCTVLVDGEPISSCLTLAVQVDGASVLTVEGLAEHPRLEPLQRVFGEEGGFQCGFCTSGQLVTIASLVLGERFETAAREAIIELLHGNLCRCTGYYGIMRAIDRVRA